MDDRYEFSQLSEAELAKRIDEDKAKAEHERRERAALERKARDCVWKGGMTC